MTFYLSWSSRDGLLLRGGGCENPTSLFISLSFPSHSLPLLCQPGILLYLLFNFPFLFSFDSLSPFRTVLPKCVAGPPLRPNSAKAC